MDVLEGLNENLLIAGGIGAAAGAVAGIVTVLSLIWQIVVIVADWRIFTKAGEKGWKSLIPFYNTFMVYRIAWETKYFWMALISQVSASLLTSFAERFNGTGLNLIFLLLALVAAVFALVLSIRQNHHLSLAFGHGTAFTVGLLFLNPIFTLILAFGSSRYVRYETMNPTW